MPLTPVRLKCAMLGLTTLKVALHKAKGTPLPDGLAGFDELDLDVVPEIEVAAADEFPPGSSKIVRDGSLSVGVYNCGGELYAIEDRCSHDDGPLCEGDWDEERCCVVCPRHGSQFELSTGRPISLPATEPVATYPVRVADGTIVLESPTPSGFAPRPCSSGSTGGTRGRRH